MAKVTPRQRVRDVQPTLLGQAPSAWIVGNVFTGTHGKEYAHIHSASNPHDRKTLSTASFGISGDLLR